MPESYDPTLQKAPRGPFTEQFLDRFHAVKENFGVAVWQLADWAGWSHSYLGNCTRRDAGTGLGLGNNVNPAFAARLKAVVERIEAMPAGTDVASVFRQPEPPKAAPARTDVASVFPQPAPAGTDAASVLSQSPEPPKAAPAEAAFPVNTATDHDLATLVATMRRVGIRSLTLFP